MTANRAPLIERLFASESFQALYAELCGTNEEAAEKDAKERATGEESPEDAPKTDIVAPAGSKVSEATHGGDEASGDIKNSPNAVSNGLQAVMETDAAAAANSSESIGDGSPDTSSGDKPDGNGHNGQNVPDGRTGESTPDSGKLPTGVRDHRHVSELDTYKLQDVAAARRVYLWVKEIACKYSGYTDTDGWTYTDKGAVARDLLKGTDYKIPSRRYNKSKETNVLVFVDTSGSMAQAYPMVARSLDILRSAGFKPSLGLCPNGFEEGSSTRRSAGSAEYVSELYTDIFGQAIRYPSMTDTEAARLCERAVFTAIVADFDGLSSYVKIARRLIASGKGDKIPYLFSTETRYSWKESTQHDWVEPGYDRYPPERAYNVYPIPGQPAGLQKRQ